MNRAESFFTDEEKRRIGETTKQIESTTSGEVVVVVVDGSDEYPDAEISGGVILGSLAALILTEILSGVVIWYYVPLSFIFFFPFRLLIRAVPDLKSRFVGEGRKNDAVVRGALSAFYQKGLCRTRDNTGVLFYISLLEHKVRVLADKGIYEKIDQAVLNNFASTVTQGIKEGRACDALCRAMTDAGLILREHFPLKHDDSNELPDEIFTK